MASQHIEITGNETRLAGDLRRFIDQLQGVQNQSAELKAVMDQAASGSDWVGLQATFGFDSTADAEATYNLLGSVNATLTTDAFIAQFLSRLG